MKKILSLGLLLISCFHVIANVSLPKIFGDNMVLQRNKPIPVWGWADANEKLTIKFNQQTKSVTADNNGKWITKLDPEKAGGPYQLIVEGKNNVTFKNVLVGEVWVCSGQSNMEMPIEGWGKVNNYEQEIKDANYPQIRHIKIPNTVASVPKDDIKSGEWEICNPQTAGDFTATGYFFARELYNQLKIPIGLINTSWGGTHVETWTSREAFENSDEFKSMIADMPALDLDSLAKIRRAAMEKRMNELQGSLPNASEVATWKNVDFDDNKWPQMQLPSLWEEKQLGELDGVVWFRKTIEISAADTGKPGTLELAMIDDNDITYVNGIEVGRTNSYNAHRKYPIPFGPFSAGKIVIAVRVEDTGGGGGIYGEPGDMRLTIGDHVISLAGDWRFHVESVEGNASSVGPNEYPTLLFNAMVNPLIPYAIEGVIWYQGEANAGRAYQYRKAFPLMITDWRKHWQQGNFPFYFVQLASWNADNGNSAKGSSWAELREAQTIALSLPNTGMAVTTDIGNSKDIHPKNKQDVGKRLAAIALHNVYDKDVVYSGPMYESMKIDGNKVKIYFKNIGGGLMAKNGDLKGFEVAGADKKFYAATTTIDGDHVVVSNENVTAPVAVRFGWMDDAGADNLFNKEGFPAGPFRTDDWPGITEKNKFAIVK
ncbi:MAG TPA: sialate O-acetylesterase [Parafilimonas sp.]|nr:sialate O-acetylesterase [Parafilimonas sp.]